MWKRRCLMNVFIILEKPLFSQILRIFTLLMLSLPPSLSQAAPVGSRAGVNRGAEDKSIFGRRPPKSRHKQVNSANWLRFVKVTALEAESWTGAVTLRGLPPRGGQAGRRGVGVREVAGGAEEGCLEVHMCACTCVRERVSERGWAQSTLLSRTCWVPGAHWGTGLTSEPGEGSNGRK